MLSEADLNLVERECYFVLNRTLDTREIVKYFVRVQINTNVNGCSRW